MSSVSVKSVLYRFCPAALRPVWHRIEASPLGYRLARGTFWSLSGMLVSRSLMLVAAVVVARLLGKTGYGEFGMIQSTVNMFGVFAGFGLGLTATKHVAEYRQNDPVRAGRIIGLSSLFTLFTGGLLALGLLIFAPCVAQYALNAPHLSGVLRIGSLILFVSALNGAQTGALSGFEAFKTVARVNLLVGFASLPMLLLGAWLGGLAGAVWALAINLLFSWALNHLALRKESRRHGVPFTLRDCVQEWPILWKFSLPVLLCGLVYIPLVWLCNAILVNQPGGYAELGVYNASSQWQVLLMFIPAMLLQTSLPVMSEANTGNEGGVGFQKTLDLMQVAIVSITMPLGVLLMFLSEDIMKVYGAGFVGGSTVLIGVISSALIAAIGAATGPALQAKGRTWLAFFINLTYGVMLLAFVLVCAKTWGASAIAFGSAASYLVTTIWAFLFLRAELPPGMLQRVIWSLLFVVGMTSICVFLPTTQRVYWTVPMCICALLFVGYFASSHFMSGRERC